MSRKNEFIHLRVSALLLIAVSFATGCWFQGAETSPENSTSAKSGSDPLAPVNTQKRSDKPLEMLAGWPDPKFALVMTGEQHGYMEPCGCSETQSGGISRRADLFRQLREDKKWAVSGVDLGGTVKRSRRQDQIKYGIIYNAMADMGYKALSLGPEDLKLQVDFLFATVPNSVDSSNTLPLVSSNVIFYDTPEIGSPARTEIIDLNGAKVGVTGYLGKKYAAKIFPQGDNSANSLLKVEDPVETLKTALATLKEAECEVLVLLSHAPQEETKAVLNALPEFHVCLTAGGPENPSGRTETVGNTLLLEAGRKGKYAGVLGYYPEEQEKFRYELVDLDMTRFKRTQMMEDHMAFYQELLREEKIVESEPAVPHPSGHTFVGSEKCGTCHTKAFEKWKSTKHSHATETLVKGREGYAETEWISRLHDPECLCCHAVGWDPQEVFRYESGYLNMDKTAHLTGQGCENCHGPGSHHTQLEEVFLTSRDSTPETVAAREAMKVDLKTAEQKVCRKCHDFENSPKFDFNTYWPKVLHRGKD